LKYLQVHAISLKIRRILVNEIERLRKTEHTFMVVVAVIIGVAGGFGAIFFRFAIRFFQGPFFGSWHYTPVSYTHLTLPTSDLV